MDQIQNSKISELLNNQPTTPVKNQPANLDEFKSILQDRLKVSSHAQTRLQSRGIDLDASAWDRVMKGVDMAAAKGAKESLVLVDNAALVVSVKNRTVITAVDKDSLKDNVFTNIDSAVVV